MGNELYFLFLESVSNVAKLVKIQKRKYKNSTWLLFSDQSMLELLIKTDAQLRVTQSMSTARLGTLPRTHF